MVAVSQIETANREMGDNAIITSDELFRLQFKDQFASESVLRDGLKLLRDAHYLFIIHIIEADEHLKVPGVDGYVIAKADVIDALISEFSKRLERIYETQFQKRKGAAMIIRELMPVVKQYNRTPLGRELNVTIMLNQYRRLLNEMSAEYDENWKQNKLAQLLHSDHSFGGGGIQLHETFIDTDVTEIQEFDEESVTQQPATSASSIRRAIDTPEYKELSQMDMSGSWGKAVEKYGVTFLIRIHLRKLELKQVRQLVEQRRITREEDLRYLRDSLRVMEERFFLDRSMTHQIEPVRELKRLVQLRLNQFSILRKNVGDDLDI